MTLYYSLCMHLPAMHIVLTSIHSKLSCCSYSVENARYDWLFQLIAHSIWAPFSCLTLNADTHLGCQHYTTFPRTAVSLSLFCYLFKIRIRRCVFISVGLTAVCFALDGPWNKKCCIGFVNPYGRMRYCTGDTMKYEQRILIKIINQVHIILAFA